jgi:hypothetical protein
MAYIGNDLRSNEDYKIIDDISSGFNGSATSFALQVGGATPVPFPKFEQQLLISVNGVIQEPDPTGSAGFKLLGTNIVFSSAPTNGHAFFGVIYAGADYVNAGGTFPDGSINFPSITFSADTNTGFTRTGSGTVALISDGNKIAQFPTSQGSSGQALITDGAGNLSFGVPTAAFTDITLAGDIIHSGDTDTKIRFSGADQVKVETAGTERVHIDGVEVVFNETGVNTDFRIEGDNNANLFKVDAGNDRIGIATSSPQHDLDILKTGSGDDTSFRVGSTATSGDNDATIVINNGGSGDASLRFDYESSASRCKIYTNSSTNDLIFDTDGNETMRLKADHNVGIGSTNPQSMLHIKGNGGVLAVDSYPTLTLETGSADATANKGTGILFLNYNGSGGTFGGSIQCLKENSSNNNESNYMRFSTRVENGSVTERVRITAAGQFRAGPESSSDRTGFAHQLSTESGSSSCLSLQNPNNGDGAQVRLGFFARNTNNAAVEFARIHMEATETQANSTQKGSLVFQTNVAGSLAERMRIDSVGNLLVGSSSSASSDVVAQFFDENSGDDSAVMIGVPTAAAGRNATLLFAPANKVAGAQIICNSEEDFSTANNRTATLSFQVRKDGSFKQAMFIQSSGAVIFGNDATPSSSNSGIRMVTPEATPLISVATATTNTTVCHQFINPNGGVGDIRMLANATQYNTSSDYRLKENAVAISDGITRLKTLKPYRFNFIKDPSITVDGFFAHEVTAVPEAITGTKDEVATEDNDILGHKKDDPIYQGIDQSKLVPLLTAALQEEIAKREALETKLQH